MAYRRITRQEMKHDEFVDRMTQITMIVEERWKGVALALAIVIVGILLVIGGITWMSRARAAARNDLARAVAVLHAPVVETGADPTNALAPSFPSEGARAEAALARLESLDAGGAVGDLTAYYRGIALIRLSRGEEAVGLLRDLAGRTDDPFLRGLAGHALASAASLSGDLAQAEQSLRELSESPQTAYPRDVVLYDLARVLELAGKPDDAADTLARLVREYPDSPLGSEARSVTRPRG